VAKVTRDKVMEVSAAALAQAITDFENYPQFVTEVVAAKKLPGGAADKPRVVFELEIVKRFKYTLEFKLDGHKEISWKLVESDFFKTNQGRWLLEAKGPKQTHVTYEVEVGFGFLVPGWITRKLTEVNLPKMFERFEDRARALSAKGAK